jgi:hypothetical protein
MIGIRPILHLIGAAYTRWLLRNLNPMAPNYPGLVLRANRWEQR